MTLLPPTPRAALAEFQRQSVLLSLASTHSVAPFPVRSGEPLRAVDEKGPPPHRSDEDEEDGSKGEGRKSNVQPDPEDQRGSPDPKDGEGRKAP